MKIQDIAFFGVLVVLLLLRKPNLLVGAGLLCLVLSVPLFGFWIFFTAQRLVEYAFLFILVGLLLSFKKS